MLILGDVPAHGRSSSRAAHDRCRRVDRVRLLCGDHRGRAHQPPPHVGRGAGTHSRHRAADLAPPPTPPPTGGGGRGKKPPHPPPVVVPPQPVPGYLPARRHHPLAQHHEESRHPPDRTTGRDLHVRCLQPTAAPPHPRARHR